MNKTDLVILRASNALILETETLYPNKVYRCSDMGENGSDGYLVYGMWFSKSDFTKFFEYAYDRVIRDLTGIGLIVNDKLVSKNKFREMADMHPYASRGQKPFYIAFFRGAEILYGFYPCFRETKAETINYTYNNLKRVFEGDLLPLDQKFIQMGNRGVPISGGDILSWYSY